MNKTKQQTTQLQYQELFDDIKTSKVHSIHVLNFMVRT